jgi:Ca-activated chloride channel homolog
MKIERLGERHATLELSGPDAREPGPVRVAFVLESGGLSGAFWAHPDARFGGGTFMLLAGLPPVVDEAARARIEREVVLVLDRSGSMKGAKFDQVCGAAKQVLGSLRPADRFAIVDYASDIACFRPQPVEASIENLIAADHYIDTLDAQGGTNIDGALAAALALEHAPGKLPLVLFLTDGQATEGEVHELAIRTNVAAANTAQRRLFTFGVGHDVNAPLLDGLAATTGAQSCYVAPDESVEAAVATLMERLRGPVFSDGVLRVLDVHGTERPDLVRYVVPSSARDLYAGDQVTVLGTYRTAEPFTLELAGSFLGEPHTFRFDFDPARDADASNTFVARLWASRRIGELTEYIRQAGADPSVANDDGVFAARPDLAEYVESIVELSIEYGILSEFTSFFAAQGTDLSNRTAIAASVGGNLLRDMLRIRVGKAAIGRSEAVRAEMYRSTLNRLGRATGTKKAGSSGPSAPETVQQIGDRAFYLRSGVWVDSRIVRRGTALVIDEYVDFGSPRHHAIVAQLIGEGRGALLSLRGVVVVEIDGRAVRLPIGAPYGPSPAPTPGAGHAAAASPNAAD